MTNLTRIKTKTLFTWSGGPRSSGVSFFCFHALGDTKQKKLTPLDRCPPLHVNRPLETKEAKKGPEMSANIAKIAKVTRFFHATLKTPMTNIANIAKITNLTKFQT